MNHDLEHVRAVFDLVRGSARASPPRHVYMALVSVLRGRVPTSLFATVSDLDDGTRWDVVAIADPELVTLSAASVRAKWRLEDGDGITPDSLAASSRAGSQLTALSVVGVEPVGGAFAGDNEWLATWQLEFVDGTTIEIREPDSSRSQDSFTALLTDLTAFLRDGA